MRADTIGTLSYGGSIASMIDDRALAHLQAVMLNKLRRGESFAYSWKTPAADGDGRSTIWVSPHIPLHFKYSGGRPPIINAAWVQVLMDTANTSRGLMLLPEPAQTE
jgi:hypothetical protein